MTPEQEITRLREEIGRHDHAYYVEGAPVLSDREYDALFQRLKDLEAAHPHLISPNSPTQRVSETPLEGFVHVTHSVAMMSIDNTYTEGQLREWDGRVAKGLDGAAYEYLVDPKIDGVSASLRYEKGRLVLGATRGDGRVGDDITANVRAIRSVPLALHGSGWPAVLEVRGEVYWPREAFEKHNAKREKEGEEPFANPRNATTGTLKSLDSKAVADRGLAFMAHGFGQIEGASFETAVELFAAMKRWGVPVSGHQRMLSGIEDVVRFVAEWDTKRRSLGYETDGLVVKVNRLDQRDILGATSRYPRWCIAYKYAAEQAETVLRDVDFQVGKLGTITPRAVMEPTQLSGTIVRHASLHNFDQVERLDVHIGDTVVVEKAGEIIPQVVRVVIEKRPTGARKIAPPTKCPVCSGEVEKDEGGVYIRCIDPSCPAQLKERLRFFCGRDQMDISGLEESVIERLVEDSLVRTYSDIYNLHAFRERLASISFTSTYGRENAEKLLQNIDVHRNQPTDKVLKRLKLPFLCEQDILALFNAFLTIGQVSSATQDQLSFVTFASMTGAKALYSYFCPDNDEILISNMVGMQKRLGKKGDVEAIGVAGLGPALIKELVNSGLVKKYADLFGLHRLREKLELIPRTVQLGETRANTILKSVEDSKERPLARVLTALNIRHVGGTTAELVADQFETMERIAETSEEHLQEVEGIGPEVAKSIQHFFTSAAGARTWQSLRDAGVNMRQPKSKKSGHQPLAGKTLVVTGTLEKFSRGDIDKLIKELGGRTSDSVSKKTDYLVVGKEAGSKLDKARELGVKVINETDFLELIGK
ncbi:MAG: NAD-dependent DNA ligase LigA [Planctomycetota bacterium]